MAKATVADVDIPITIKAKRVTLELTMAEARTLLTVINRIGGDPETSLRGLVDNIYEALASKQIRPYEKADGQVPIACSTGSQSLYFDNHTMNLVKSGETD